MNVAERVNSTNMKIYRKVGYVATVTVNMLLIGQITMIVAKNGRAGNE